MSIYDFAHNTTPITPDDLIPLATNLPASELRPGDLVSAATLPLTHQTAWYRVATLDRPDDGGGDVRLILDGPGDDLVGLRLHPSQVVTVQPRTPGESAANTCTLAVVYNIEMTDDEVNSTSYTWFATGTPWQDVVAHFNEQVAGAARRAGGYDMTPEVVRLVLVPGVPLSLVTSRAPEAAADMDDYLCEHRTEDMEYRLPALVRGVRP